MRWIFELVCLHWCVHLLPASMGPGRMDMSLAIHLMVMTRRCSLADGLRSRSSLCVGGRRVACLCAGRRGGGEEGRRGGTFADDRCKSPSSWTPLVSGGSGEEEEEEKEEEEEEEEEGRFISCTMAFSGTFLPLAKIERGADVPGM